MVLTGIQRKKLDDALRSGGIFVTCGKKNPNLMSTHWGALGSFWNRQIFVLPVRKGKRSHEILEEYKSFAVSVPTTDMRHELMLCDSMSGYTVNKFEALHLHPKRARKIPAYVLGDCGLILECKVIYTALPTDGFIEDALRADMYAGKEPHVMYFGEVVECYENK